MIKRPNKPIKLWSWIELLDVVTATIANPKGDLRENAKIANQLIASWKAEHNLE